MKKSSIEKGYIHASIEKNNGVRLEINGEVNDKHIFVVMDGLLTLLQKNNTAFDEVSQVLMQSLGRVYKDDMKDLFATFNNIEKDNDDLS